jgi:putative oxygen-independent coproporphyrinogen III oxidase
MVKIGSGDAGATTPREARNPVQHYLRPGVLSLPALPPLSLYVHLPWCIRKCPYCDFNSHEYQGGHHAIPEKSYLEALRTDLEQSLPLIWGRPIISIFFGGGTPSLFSPAGIERFLSDARALLPLQADCEITLEANPGTFEANRFAAFRAAGVNRLSLGIQSFDDSKLRVLGRVHGRAEALAAAESARRLFDNFNLDLMYGLPGQDADALESDVRQALELEPPHLSLYQLTLEPNTVFAKFPPELPDEDVTAQMSDWIEASTAAAGYFHYEVSAYAKPGFDCRHNLNYWLFGDYLGIGAGAHSKLSFPHRILRQIRLRQPESYLKGIQSGAMVVETTEVPRAHLPFEFMLNALRLTRGVPRGLFAERTGAPLSQLDATLSIAVGRGLLSDEEGCIAPTALGRRFLNDLQAIFLP